MPMSTFIFNTAKISNFLLDAGWGRVTIGIFTLWASQSHHIGFVVAHLR
jgi:hypothetical protein